jgi:ABC-type Na+ efflux pump permease subunit
MGELLLSILRDEGLADLVAVNEAAGAEEAWALVDSGEAGVALTIPPDFSAVLAGDQGEAVIDLYQDPTLTLGPGIVRGLVSGLVDQFLTGRIGIGVAIEQAAEAGLPVDEALVNEIVAAHIVPMQQQVGASTDALVVVRPPADSSGNGGDNEFSAFLGTILAGQLVFFAFFTGASALQSILTEDERGTLQRLFTTPTSHLSIIAGKYGSTLLLLVVQFVVLTVIGAVVFTIYWGLPLSVLLAGIGLFVGAATTGLFLVSMMRTSRQGGIVFGGVLTITGLIGMLPVFTASVPEPPPLVSTISLLTPQGWVLRGLSEAMSDASAAAVALNTAVIFVWCLVFAFVAQHRLRRRFDR